jgi:hypothetical protein
VLNKNVMPIDVEKFKSEMTEWAESEQGKAHFAKYWYKISLTQSRFDRFTEWLKHNDFEKLMYRLLLEHDEEYREKCWHSGCEVYPNNKLSFLIDYAIVNGEQVKVPELDNKFPNNIWLFKGYYFQMTYGQGTVTDIYNQEDKRHLLRV